MFHRPYPWRVALRPVLRWSAVLALAGAAGLTTASVTGRVARERASWGASQPTLVARVAIAAGEAIDEHNTSLVVLPAALVGTDALASRPLGEVAAVRLAAGEVVRRDRLGRSNRSAVAALVPAGRHAVSVPRSDDTLPLVVGDRVRIVAALQDVPGAAPSTAADGALVVHVTEHSAVIAVDDADLPAVARALADGAAVIALSG